MSKKDKEETVVVIFIEGETEIEFYKRFVGVMRTYCGGQLTCISRAKRMEILCRLWT